MQERFNRERLVKLMNLTTSDNDNEALNAVRTANGMIKKAGLAWDIVIEGGDPSPKSPHVRYSSRSKEPYATPKEAPRYEVDEDEVWNMITYIRNNAYEGFDLSFVDSIENNFGIYRRLTWKQLKGLRNIFDTIKANHGRSNV